MKELKKDSNPSEYRFWYNDWVEKNAKGNVLDVGRSRFWDYEFPTIDNNSEMSPTYLDDICKCSLPSNTFDMVLCNGVYQMIKDPKGMIDEIYRILKKEGIAIFGFAGTEYIRYDLNKMARWKVYDNDVDFKEFKIINRKDFNKEYHYIICQK